MEWLDNLWRRTLVLLKREQFQRDLEEEMQFHLDMQARENREAGMDGGEAAHAARRQFGNATLLREAGREVWGFGPAERIGQDVRYALRMVRRDPGFSAVVVLVLALGIGGSTAVFSMINALLLNPFPYPGAGRLVAVRVRQNSGDIRTTVPIRDLFEWRRHNATLEWIAAYGWFRSNVTGIEESERMIGGTATADFLRVLGVQPALGRFFTPAEDTPGGPAVVVLSHGLWKRRFGARADVLGRTLTLGGRPHTIIGIMPAHFALPGMFTCEFWRPSAFSPAIARGTWMDGDRVIARLKPGVPAAQAEADLKLIAARLDGQYLAARREWEPSVVPIGRELAEDTAGFLAAPAAAAGLVLLAACANLAGLLLARSTARAKEMAVRASLGAGRRRLVRQMLTESVLLSVAGGVLGLAFAGWAIRAVITVAPANAGLGSALRIDGPVLFFALGVSVLTGICFGLAPAVYGTRPDLETLLKGAAGASSAKPRNRFLAGLVVAEVALAVVLLTGGGLLLKSFSRLLHVDLGIRTGQLLTFQLGLPGPKYGSEQRRGEFYLALLERLRSIPAVRDAGAVDPLPMSGQYSGGGFQIDGRPVPARWRDMAAQYCQAAPGYFRTMGIPVLLGREFEERDRSGTAVIINRALARRFFAGQNPLDAKINGTPVVGVVGDVRHNGPAKEPEPQIYAPFARRAPWSASIAVRTDGDPAELAQLVRAEVHALDPGLPLDRLKPMQQVVWDSVAAARTISAILGGFAAFALALAALGIYGVVAYSVNRRTQEIGIRVALGASPGNVLALLVSRGALLGAAGVGIGVPAALALSRGIESLLFGVRPHDAGVFLAVPAVLLAVTLAASYLPARRAARLDPMGALRRE